MRPVPSAFRAVLIATLAAVSVSADVRLTEGTHRYGDQRLPSWIVENEHTRIEIVPGRGGRVASWIDKAGGGADVVWLSRKPGEAEYGGLLDDHGWTTQHVDRGNFYRAAYRCSVVVDTPARVTLETWPEGTRHLRRRITMRAGRPGFEVEYTLVNDGQEAGGNALVRGVVWPSGEPIGAADVYLTPLRTGVQIADWVGGPGVDMGAPWRAFHSRAAGRTVAFAFADSLFAGPYDWGGSADRPTFEWYYHPVAPGTSVTTRAHAWILHGFETLAHVDGRLAASLAPRRDGEDVVVDGRLSSLDPALRALRLRTEARSLDGRSLAVAALALDDLEVNRPQRLSARLAVPAGEAAVIRQVAVVDGEAVAEWEVPFEAAPGAYERQLAFAETLRSTPIPGWEPVAQHLPQPDAAARARGYLVHLGEGPGAGAPVDALRLDLGVDEYESLEIRVHALAPVGDSVRVEARLSADAPAVAVSATEARTVEIWGRTERGWRLTREPAAAIDTGETVRFWLIAHSDGVAPGTYEAAVRVTPAAAPPVEVPLRLRVWPVRLPEDRAFYLDVNSRLDELGLPDGARRAQPVWDWDTLGTARYADDLRAHGVRVVRAYGFARPGGRYEGLRLRATGQRLTEALDEDPDLLRTADALPALDLSFWDPWLHVWLERGFRRYVTYVIYPVGDAEANVRAHAEFARKHGLTPERAWTWLWRETGRYLKEKGLRHVYGGIDDELAADRLETQYVPAAGTARAAGWSPFVTVFEDLLQNEALYRQVGPQMDYWAFGGIVEPETVARIRADGYAGPQDMVGTYEGWGTFWQDYGWFRAGFWPRALSGTDVFWVQCYLRGYSESIAFDDVPGGPYSSGAWEAVRDGVEDANYLRMAMALIEQLEAEAAVGFRARLEALAARVDESDPATIRRAKADLLRLLVDLRPQLPASAPTLRWHELPLIEGGSPRYAVVGPVAKAAILADRMRARTGVVPDIAPDGGLPGEDAILLGHPDSSPALRALAAAGVDLGVTESYPPADGYAIVEADAGGHHYIALIGRGAGLCRGVEIFSRLLTVDAVDSATGRFRP